MSGHFSATLVDNVDWIDGFDFRMRRGFRYYLTADEGGEFVDVPAGFVTNFASTPRLTWPILPPTGRYSQVAATHDKLFRAPVIRSAHSARPCTLGEANRIFVNGSKVLGVSWPVRRLMFRMLQAFSGAAWNRYRAADRRT